MAFLPSVIPVLGVFLVDIRKVLGLPLTRVDQSLDVSRRSKPPPKELFSDIVSSSRFLQQMKNNNPAPAPGFGSYQSSLTQNNTPATGTSGLWN
ncbi:uncharacterized protein CIMG_12777 [Coccidioides immitis RS]|uniref:Uncharacterized protein n=1 Tax=Coccidioides immitis (strain RS) TaxID=246410 RepID=A0A0D8JV59_COCIM|nr:uncharacterized protein CIMG_12777 [Coccidioides immitis RS]KJF60148.1 hypothetical protein CIMG_12777 [Coccidioides immitis RS]